MQIGVFYGESKIQEQVADALGKGIVANGHEVKILHDKKYSTAFDGIAFYGMSVPHITACKEYRSAGKPVVIVDLGYLGSDRGTNGGYLKVAVNYWHPTKYFQKVKHLGDRLVPFKLNIKPMRKNGSSILLAGIGPKSAVLYGMRHQSWDEHAVSEIKKHTDRKIVYRVKPSGIASFKPIPGTVMSDPLKPLNQQLQGIWAVVTHHSNVAVDGIIEGIPCFVNDGVSSAIGLSDLSQIESPRMPKPVEQQQFLADLAYTQWTLKEIASGKTWRHFEKEGLLTDPQP